MEATTQKRKMTTADFVTIETKDGIATVWIDHQLEKANIVSPEVIGIFGEVFEKLQNDQAVKAVVLISRKKDFIAGADIKAFEIEKEGDFKPFQAYGHKALAQLEAGSKPVVAAIHGACLGLGTEVALACHARIASTSPSTHIGVPEVMLGILPGGGGTQRLPKYVGIQKALDMCLTGRKIYAYKAKKIGLVDALTDEHKLHHAATIMARRLLKEPIKRKSPLSFKDKLLEGPLKGMVFKTAKKMAFKRAQGNYPAIPAIIDCIETGVRKGSAAGYAKELEHFEKLMLGPESAALRSLFFGMTDNKRNPYGDPAQPISAFGMIGAGFMGAGIAEVSVNKDIRVHLKDIEADTLRKAQKQIWKGLAKKIKRRSLRKTEGERRIGLLAPQLSYDNFDQLDLVIEAVVEKMSVKKIIIDEIQQHCPEDVIIATNTSSLSVTEMAKHAKRPEQVIGMHYFSPVPKMPLLEIVKTEYTSEAVISACYDLGVRQGKTCVVVQDGPGFYVNRILAPYLNECLLMIDEGLAFDVIDKALVKKGFPVGPISLLDEVGLDIAAHVTESTSEAIDGREGFVPCEGVLKMAKAGRMGKKNGQGFYKYGGKKGKRSGPDPSAYQFFKGNGKSTLPLEEMQDRAVMLMLNEAVLCLEEGIIANPKDGDLGAVFGIGFLPFTGGPFRAIDQWGVENVVNRMLELKAKYGPKFNPAKTLGEMALRKGTFH